ncbi:MAG TPA: glycosyltransferase family 1 protein, partial [Thermoanaerobaculia bacterium]|nr:glycosyltransferase family 1 protein [Thermoanaerobaculia bacterium]
DFGIGTYIRGLLGGLLELGMPDEYVAFAPADARLPAGIEHVVVNAPHYSARELVVIGRAADRARLDVFHAPHYVVPFTRVPVVVTIHDLIHLHQPQRNPLAPIYARAMITRAIRKARVVLTVSEAVKRELESELGAKNVIVTPNGVAPAALGRRPVTPTFLYVGNDKPHKNVETLVNALALAPNITLTLAGAPFARFRERERVTIAGFVDDLAPLYDSAIALVMPSVEEGFGLPALEAMARGVPVITSNAAALLEVTGDAALHFDARDARALADVMTRVANDASLRAEMSARGVERARLFTWKRCAESTRKAYEIVEHRGTSGAELRF